MPEQKPLTWTDVDPRMVSFRWWYDELVEVVEVEAEDEDNLD